MEVNLELSIGLPLYASKSSSSTEASGATSDSTAVMAAAESAHKPYLHAFRLFIPL